MAKPKQERGARKIQNRQNHARMSFLYQAATYFASLPPVSGTKQELEEPRRSNDVVSDAGMSFEGLVKTLETTVAPNSDDSTPQPHHPCPSSSYLASHLLTVGTKSSSKVSQSIKRSICKRCHCVLIEGKTSAVSLENLSRAARKPWADVLLISCQVCGMEKRYPLHKQSLQDTKNDRSVRVAPHIIAGSSSVAQS